MIEGKPGFSLPHNAIQLEMLETMFSQMAKKAKWDTSRPLLWGYFFSNAERPQLDKTLDILEANGYEYVDLSTREDGAWWLHVEKVEVHTPESLHERNMLFYQLAYEQNLASYDGMDVGPCEQ